MTSTAPDRLLTRMRAWSSLVRLSHTVFALPFALSGLLLGVGGMPDLSTIALCVLCVVTARNAAMAWNRFVDREFDARNPRTAMRELPARRLRPRSVVVFTFLNAALFVAATALLPPPCLALSPLALVLVMGYSHLKRFTAAAHFGLGLAIGISPLAAHLAAGGGWSIPAIVLSLSLWAWISGFDIVYACQDESSDRLEGLRSIPVRLGTRGALRIAALLHAMFVVLLAVFGLTAGFGLPWAVLTLLVAAGLVAVHARKRADDLQHNTLLFRANAAISLGVFLTTSLEILV